MNKKDWLCVQKINFLNKILKKDWPKYKNDY